ncbi:hypothetical protein IJH66_02505 [Candidatus Saccharibacteria bacterium]|nr:hypothetical protein [Candidatus Saccharibacteria bacterium]MBQ6605830.1 hypothetical protein [Candidatus Saccharibacteria bacterium]
MSEPSSLFRIPSFKREEAYNFADPEDFEVYSELNKIAEEIEQCRLNAR